MNAPFGRRAAGTSAAIPAAHERDVYAWAMEQAQLLRAGRMAELDAINIAEELEDLGRSEFHRLRSALRVLLTHMLKWDHQPRRRSRSWANTISAQRLAVQMVLRDNPSLRRRIDEALADAYPAARLDASSETDMDLAVFPEVLPYDWAAITDRPFVFEPPPRRGR
jgi:hypothetical protein